MTARTALTVVGQAVGGYFAGPWGAAIGGALGGAIGGAIDGPVRNSQSLIDDLNAVKFDYGSSWTRIYGRYRLKAAPLWSSIKRPVRHDEEIDAKGGPAAVNTSFTYVQDWLIWGPLNAIGFSRVWVNGELKFTNLAESGVASIAASRATTAWASATFFDGNASQMPWPIYEADVGTENAVAYRYRPTLGLESIDLGASGQPPLIEVEWYTAADVVPVDGLMADLTTPPGAYLGVGTPAFSNNGFQMWVGQWDNSYLTRLAIVYNVAADGTATFAAYVEVADTGPGGLGNSDESGLMVASQSPWETIYWQWSLEGFYATFYLPPGGGMASGMRFSKVGDDFVFACQQSGFGLKQIYRFERTNPAAQATSVVMDTVSGCSGYFASIAIGGTKVYALDLSGDLIVQLTLSTLAVETTFATPSTDPNGSVVCDEQGSLHFASDSAGTVWKWTGSAWIIVYTGVSAVIGSSGTCSFGFAEGTFFAVGGSAAGYAPADHVHINRALESVEPTAVQVADVIRSEELLEWTGEAGALTEDDIDLDDLAGLELTGFATSGSPREAVAQLMDWYYVGVVCSDKLYHRLRGAASIATVPWDHTGSGVGRAAEPFTGIERANDLEVAIQVAVTGPNVLADYEPGTESSDRLVGESQELRRYQTAVVATPAERKGRADTMVLDGRVAANTASVALDDRYAHFEPFDTWDQYDDEGNLYRLRGDRETYSDSGRVFDAVLDDPSVLSSSGITAETDSRAITVASPPATDLILIDGPSMRDADVPNPGIYGAVVGSGKWPGAVVLGGAAANSLSQLATVSSSAVVGITQTALGDWTGGNVFDALNTVRVVVRGGTLAGSTIEIEITTPANVFAFIKADGTVEIVQAVNVDQVADKTYDLSLFLRGRFGTEQLMAGHAIGETVVWMRTPGGLARLTDAVADINVERFYKAVTIGATTDSVSAQAFTDTGVSQKPYAVVDLRKSESAGAIIVNWDRRSRLNSRFLATTAVPLGEASESYDVDLYDASDVFVSSETVTEPQWSMSSSTVTEQFATWAREVVVISSEIVGINIGQFVRLSADGASVIATSSGLGNEIYQWVNDGDELYAAAADLAGGGVTIASTIKRVTRTALGTVAATYTAPAAGDIQGVACDGTNIWIAELFNGNLRKLDKTTLASVATYAMSAGMTRLYHYAGSLWIASTYTHEVIEWDIATTTELQRFTVVDYPAELLIVGGLIFVRGNAAIACYDTATGALVETGPALTGNKAGLCEYGSYVAVSSGTTIYLLDSTTGVLARSIDASVTYLGVTYTFLSYLSGAIGSVLYATLVVPGSTINTLGFELLAPALSGYSVTVYQNGALGRGYPATLEL